MNVPRQAWASLTQNLVSGSKAGKRVEAESSGGTERPVPDKQLCMAQKSTYLHMASWKEVPRNPRAGPEGGTTGMGLRFGHQHSPDGVSRTQAHTS